MVGGDVTGGTERSSRDVRRAWVASLAILVVMAFSPRGAKAQELGRAQIALSQRDYKTAEAVLQEAVKKAPTSAEAHYLLGLALKGLRRPDEARPQFEEALRIRSKYAEARAEIGLLQIHKGQYAEAEATFRKGIDQQLKPAGPLYFGMGMVKIASDSLKAAGSWLTRATMDDPRQSAYYRALGDVYAKQKVAELAVEQYTRALDLDAKSPEVHYAIGKMHFVEKKWPEVVKAWSDAIAADSNFVQAYTDLVNLYDIMRPPRYEEMVPLLRKMVDLLPEDLTVPVRLAKAMARTPSFRADALPYLDRAAALAPADTILYVLMGDIATGAKDYSRAVAAYRKAVDIAPDYVGALKGLADAQKAVGDTTAAISTLQRVAEKDTSGGGGAEGALGVLLYQQGRYDEAIPNLKEKLKTSPKVALLYRLLGLCYIRKNDFGSVVSEVKPAMESAVEAYPEEGDRLSAEYSILGGELFKAKRFGEAIELFQKRLERDPSNWSVHLNVGLAQFSLKAYAKAVEAFKKVAQYKPDNAQAYFMQGVCYSNLDHAALAKGAFLKTLELDPKNVDALKQVGLSILLDSQSLQKAEKHKESQAVAGKAAGYFQQAVSLRSGDEQAHVLLAQAFVLSKQLEKAKDEFRRVLRMNSNNKDAQQGLERLEGGP